MNTPLVQKVPSHVTPSSPHGGYNRGNELFLSLTLSLYTGSHYSHNTTIMFHTQTVFALSHIYTHMTFGLFTYMAPRGSLEHIHICFPSNRSREVTTGPLVIQFFSRPIRRDLFPNIDHSSGVVGWNGFFYPIYFFSFYLMLFY